MKIREMNNDIFAKIQALQTFERLTLDDANIMDMDYFNIHSGDKTCLGYVDALYTNSKETANTTLAKIIALRYKDKWNSLYQSLIAITPNSFKNFEYEEVETPNITKSISETESKEEHGSKSKDNTFNRSDTDNQSKTSEETGNATEINNLSSNQKEGTKLTTSDNNTEENKVYGFNSDVSVGNNDTNVNKTREVSGNADENTLNTTEERNKDTTNTKNATENSDRTFSRSDTGNEEESSQNTISRNNEVLEQELGDRKFTKSGLYNITRQEIIKQEIGLRNLYNLYNIIYEDVDKIIALAIYD